MIHGNDINYDIHTIHNYIYVHHMKQIMASVHLAAFKLGRKNGRTQIKLITY